LGHLIPFAIFREHRRRKERAREPRQRRQVGQYFYPDLRGKRPNGHPKVQFGPRGKVLLQKGQVWVERHTKRLFVITQVVVAREGFYPHDVIVQGYRQGPHTSYPYSESNFRTQFEVWDTFGELGNVLVRKLEHMSDGEKSIVIWAGVTLAALIHLPGSRTGAEAALAAAWEQVALVGGIGLCLVGMSLALQYGLSRMPANRAIVVLLFELVVAAVAAWALAGEVMRAQDWVGGALIVAATAVSAYCSASRSDPGPRAAAASIPSSGAPPPRS